MTGVDELSWQRHLRHDPVALDVVAWLPHTVGVAERWPDCLLLLQLGVLDEGNIVERCKSGMLVVEIPLTVR